MSEYLGESWKCRCGEIDTSEPWTCPGCGTEVCENCFWEFMHCKKCSESQLDKNVLRLKAVEVYMVEFEGAACEP